MQLRSEVSLSDGHRNLRTVIKEIGAQAVDWNEVTTRIHFIDRLLVECLGWPKTPDKFRVEVHQDGEFQDYVLGAPDLVVWEAKWTGVSFDFPASSDRKQVGVAARFIQNRTLTPVPDPACLSGRF
jgi:hypothetical protein